jgi:hypothetical protein
MAVQGESAHHLGGDACVRSRSARRALSCMTPPAAGRVRAVERDPLVLRTTASARSLGAAHRRVAADVD